MMGRRAKKEERGGEREVEERDQVLLGTQQEKDR